MAFFDKVGATISSGFDTAKNKANNMMEVTNLNGQIRSCEDQLKNYFLEIGKAYYAANTIDTVDASMKEQFSKVKEAEEAIATLKVQLRKAKGTVECQKCGAEVPVGTVFCSTCGTKIEDNAVAETSAAESACPSCGKPVKAGAQFCASCGAKIS